jgi:hypothetical protein
VTLDSLLLKAFDRVPAMEANSAITRVRTEQAVGPEDALSYEIVIDPSHDLKWAADKVLPRLVYFLDCRGLKLDQARGVFVSLFVGEILYFIRATDFVSELAPVAGLSLEELVVRYGAASV